MLEAVRIFARQQMPNYRKPASFCIKESYPLPPYSTVIGLAHALCGWQSYHPMQVSIQGRSAATVSDYATNYVFGTIPLDRAWRAVDVGQGKQAGITKLPRAYELLTDVELLLHLVPDDPADLAQILAAFDEPPVYPSLGRYEDLLQIQEVDIVGLENAEDSVVTRYDAFVPMESIDPFFNKNIVGTVYRLGKVFEYDNGKSRSAAAHKKSNRVWKEIVTARHICADVQLAATQGIYYDKCNHDPVFPA